MDETSRERALSELAEYERKRAKQSRSRAKSAKTEGERQAYLKLAQIFDTRAAEVEGSNDGR